MSGEQGTQSKYRKVRKKAEQPQIEDNEVRITTAGRVKKYVDYAMRLLEGPPPTSQTQAQTRTSATDETKDSATATATTGKEEQTTTAESATEATTTATTEAATTSGKEKESESEQQSQSQSQSQQKAEPSQKFDTIVLKATGRAINQAVTTAEVVKRRVGGLHQLTSLETLEITDTWEPTEEGLRTVTTTRRVASITITLSRKEDDVDTKAPGYQEPISATDATGSTHLPSYLSSHAVGGWEAYTYGRNYDNRGQRRGGGGGYQSRGPNRNQRPYNNRRPYQGGGGGYGQQQQQRRGQYDNRGGNMGGPRRRFDNRGNQGGYQGQGGQQQQRRQYGGNQGDRFGNRGPMRRGGFGGQQQQQQRRGGGGGGNYGQRRY